MVDLVVRGFRVRERERERERERGGGEMRELEGEEQRSE
jgi:hypothetical protein